VQQLRRASHQPFEADEKRERKESGEVAIDTTFKGEGGTFGFKFKFTTKKGPRQCPVVLLVMVGYVWVRDLEVKKAR
jgi:hypothetical protein